MNKKKVISIVSISIGFLLVFNVLFLNGFIRSVIINELQTVFQTPVEVKSVQLVFHPFGVVINGLKFIGSDQLEFFRFESPQVKMVLQFSELIKGRFIIDSLDVLDAKVVTRFHSSSNTMPAPLMKSIQKDALVLGSGSEYDHDSMFDYLLANRSLLGKEQSLTILDQLTLDESTLEDYVSFAVDQEIVNGFNKSLNSIMTVLTQPQIDDIELLRRDIDALHKDVHVFKQDLMSRKQHVNVLYQDRYELVSGLTSYFDQDYEHLKSMVQLESYQFGSLSESVLNTIFSDYIHIYSAYVQLASRWIYMLSESDHYSMSHSTGHLPRVWIKKLVFSGSHSPFYVRMFNISSNQSLIGKPIRFQFNDGKKEVFASYFVEDVLTQVYSIKHVPFSLTSFPIYSEAHEDVMLQSATQQITADFKVVGNRLSGAVDFHSSDMHVSSGQLDRLSLSSLIFDSLDRIDSVTINALLSGTLQAPSVTISSDFDSFVEDRFNQAMMQEQKRQLQLLNEAISIRLRLDQSMVLTKLDSLYNPSLDVLDGTQRQVDQLMEAIALTERESFVIKQKRDAFAKQEMERRHREALLAIEFEKKQQEAAIALEKEKKSSVLSLDHADEDVNYHGDENAQESVLSLEHDNQDSAFIFEK